MDRKLIFKCLVLCVLSSLFCFSFASCTVSIPNETFYPVTSERTVGFFKDEPKELIDIDTIKVEDYADYKSDFSKYNSYIHYDTLGEKDKLVYRIFEYALDHSFPHIVLSDMVLKELEQPIERILYYLSLDSAMVEQNLMISQKTQTRTGKNSLGKVEYEISSHLITVKVFSKDKMDKKTEAIKKAEQILADIPTHLTYEGRVGEIYKYLGENVTYSVYEDGDDANYLYDALLLGKTQCDGFANAFSLLCNMSGIPCFEKSYTPTDGSEGHTWNTFCLDGKWYNADVTAYDSVSKYNSPISLFFGYSDEFETNHHNYSSLVPECNEVLGVDLYFESERQRGAVADVVNAYETNGKGYVIICFSSAVTNIGDFMQNVADEMNKDISYTAVANKLYCIYGG